MAVKKMKEKCKDAARMRREKERAEFVELSKLLPLPSSITSQLDKASVIRLTSSYLRLRAAFPDGLGEHWGSKKAPHKSVTTNGNQRGASCNDDDDEELSAHSAACRVHTKHTKQESNQLIGLSPIKPVCERTINLTQSQHQQQPQHIKELGSLLLQTLDGFVFALHRDGKIMYISETASVLLGLPQIDLTGSSVFDYVHAADHQDLRDVLNLNHQSDFIHDEVYSPESNIIFNQTNGGGHRILELSRSFIIRMKCILPKRNAGLVSEGYKVIHCSGYLKLRCGTAAMRQSSKDADCDKFSTSNHEHHSCGNWESYALVAVGHSMLPSASTEVKLGPQAFIFRSGVDLRLNYIEAPVMKILGFQQSELIGQTLYQFVHVSDHHHLENIHRLVLTKTQVVSEYYRLSIRDGGFVWIQTYATLMCSAKCSTKPRSIVGVCFVIGYDYSDKSLVYSQNNTDATSVCKINKQTDELIPNLKMFELPQATNDQTLAGTSNSSETTVLSKRKEKLEVNLNNNIKRARTKQLVEFSILAQQDNSNISHGLERCLPTSSYELNSQYQYKSIGFTRRPSDDTSSVLSSVASTNITFCSTTSSSYSSPSSSSSQIDSPISRPVNDAYQQILPLDQQHLVQLGSFESMTPANNQVWNNQSNLYDRYYIEENNSNITTDYQYQQQFYKTTTQPIIYTGIEMTNGQSTYFL